MCCYLLGGLEDLPAGHGEAQHVQSQLARLRSGPQDGQNPSIRKSQCFLFISAEFRIETQLLYRKGHQHVQRQAHQRLRHFHLGRNPLSRTFQKSPRFRRGRM